MRHSVQYVVHDHAARERLAVLPVGLEDLLVHAGDDQLGVSTQIRLGHQSQFTRTISSAWRT